MGKCQSAKNNLTFSRKNGNIKDFSVIVLFDEEFFKKLPEKFCSMPKKQKKVLKSIYPSEVDFKTI